MNAGPIRPDHPPLHGALATLWPLLGRPIALHRRLVDVCGGMKTALMLSQAIYWTRKGVAIAERGGWFHKRLEDWHRETGLGRRSQERARRRLKALGVMQERLQGLPARLEFCLDFTAVSRLVQTDATIEGALFGAPMAFHRSLAELTHSVTSGLLLSSLLHLSRRRLIESAAERRDSPWISKSATRWMTDTGLSRREFDGARARLTDLGLLQERLCGVPPVLEMRINLAALTRVFDARNQTESAQDANLYVLDKQGCRIPATKDEGSLNPSLSRTYKLDWPKRANQFGGNVHDSLAESAKSIEGMTTALTTDLLPPPTQVEREERHIADSGGGGCSDLSRPLKFPPSLNIPERQAIGELLIRLPNESAQVLLDELDGRLRQSGALPITNRVGYIRRLRDLQVIGCFIPELAIGVQSQRLRQRAEAARAETEVADRAARAELEASPASRNRGRQELARLRAMLEATCAAAGGIPSP
jgi:hypothetical protein